MPIPRESDSAYTFTTDGIGVVSIAMPLCEIRELDADGSARATVAS